MAEEEMAVDMAVITLAKDMVTYQGWIDTKLATGQDPQTACAEWTAEMKARFPELIRVRGQIALSNLWLRDHWWLTDPNGTIVDPTVSQFDSDYFGHAKVLAYLLRDESEPEPTGKCPNCEGYCFGGGTCCSDECGIAYAEYCMKPNLY